MLQNEEETQVLTFAKLEPVNVGHFVLKNEPFIKIIAANESVVSALDSTKV